MRDLAFYLAAGGKPVHVIIGSQLYSFGIKRVGVIPNRTEDEKIKPLAPTHNPLREHGPDREQEPHLLRPF